MSLINKVIPKIRYLINRYFIILFYRNPINILCGQKIYGNDSGLIANSIGNYVINRNKKKFNGVNPSDLINKTTLKDLKDNGFTKLNFTISEDIIDQVNNEFNDAIQNIDIDVMGKIELTSINNPLFYQKFKSIHKVLSNKLINIIECYYEASFDILNTHIYRTHNLEKLKTNANSRSLFGGAAYWHNDYSTTDSLKIFVILKDTSEETGPMHIINKSDSSRIIKNGFYKYKDGIMNGLVEKNSKVTKLIGNKGTIFIADTNTCLHRAGIPKNKSERDMLVFYIISSSKKFAGIDFDRATKQQFLGFRRLLHKY